MMLISPLVLVIVWASDATAIRCRCNQAFKEANNRAIESKTGLEAAIGNCTSDMVCEVSEAQCTHVGGCRMVLDFLKPAAVVYPTCLYEADGLQGCHWFGFKGDVTERCDDVTKRCDDVTERCDDVTKRCDDVTERCGVPPCGKPGAGPNYHCRTKDLCNDIPAGNFSGFCDGGKKLG